MADEALAAMKSIESKLGAILGLLVERHLRDTGSTSRVRSIERVLTDSGMTGAQTGRLLGKSPQAVSQALAREARTTRRTGTVTKVEPATDQEG